MVHTWDPGKTYSKIPKRNRQRANPVKSLTTPCMHMMIPKVIMRPPIYQDGRLICLRMMLLGISSSCQNFLQIWPCPHTFVSLVPTKYNVRDEEDGQTCVVLDSRQPKVGVHSLDLRVPYIGAVQVLCSPRQQKLLHCNQDMSTHGNQVQQGEHRNEPNVDLL